MPEKLVPTVATPVSPTTLYAALRGAWTGLYDAVPARQSLLVLIGHWALETEWGHATWCWNLGNAKHVPGDGRDYFQIRCNEIINGKTVWFDPPHPATSFRAFAGLAEGCVDYLGLLHGQFGYAWPAIEAGDAPAFCHALRQRGYYTADEQAYTTGVMAYMLLADHRIPVDEPAAVPGLAVALLDPVTDAPSDGTT